MCLCFFGDGAANQGAFHEGINLAAVWKLPAIYLCENNLYAVTTHTTEVTSVGDIAERAKAYGIPGAVVDGQDVLAVHEAVSVAVARARAGAGPSLIEAKTYRFTDHAEGTSHIAGYRSEDEVNEWRRLDPVLTFRTRLLGLGVLSELGERKIAEEVAAEVNEAVTFARSSPFPDASTAFNGLYTEV